MYSRRPSLASTNGRMNKAIHPPTAQAKLRLKGEDCPMSQDKIIIVMDIICNNLIFMIKGKYNMDIYNPYKI